MAAPRAARAGAAATAEHVRVHDMSALSERLARTAGFWNCRLTHYGRKSGRPYEVTIWFLVDGETIYLSTMNRKRQWTRNVQRNPNVRLAVGGESFEGRVSLLTEPDEIARVVELLKAKYWITRPYFWFKSAPDGAFRLDVVDAGASTAD